MSDALVIKLNFSGELEQLLLIHDLLLKWFGRIAWSDATREVEMDMTHSVMVGWLRTVLIPTEMAGICGETAI